MKRIVAHMITLIFTMNALIRSVFQMHSTEYIIWCIPYLVSSTAILFFLIISLLRKPKDINESFIMFLVAVISTNLPIFIGYKGYMFPMGSINYSLIELAKNINLMVMPFYIWGVLTLGRRLTVLPEANSLQTNGAYKVSRHPLYVTYIFWYTLQNLTFQTWLVLAVSIVQIALIIIRARYEEKILEKNFPDYKEYKAQVMWIGRRRRRESIHAGGEATSIDA